MSDQMLTAYTFSDGSLIVCDDIHELIDLFNEKYYQTRDWYVITQSVYESINVLSTTLSILPANCIVIYFNKLKFFNNQQHFQFINKMKKIYVNFIKKNKLIMMILEPKLYNPELFKFEKKNKYENARKIIKNDLIQKI